MRNIILVLSALLFSTVCEADDREPTINLKKYCEKLSKETGEEYLYGEGMLKSHGASVPVTCSPPYPGEIIRAERCSNRESIQILDIYFQNGNIKRLRFYYDYASTPNVFLELKNGKHYGFCYKKEKNIFIGYSENLNELNN